MGAIIMNRITENLKLVAPGDSLSRETKNCQNEYTSSWGPTVRKTMEFKSSSLQSKGGQPTSFWKFFALHSSQTEKTNLNDLVILAERNPLSSPTSSSLLQCVYGFSDSSFILSASNFLRCRYFLPCFRNSGVKYGL